MTQSQLWDIPIAVQIKYRTAFEKHGLRTTSQRLRIFLGGYLNSDFYFEALIIKFIYICLVITERKRMNNQEEVCLVGIGEGGNYA